MKYLIIVKSLIGVEVLVNSISVAFFGCKNITKTCMEKFQERFGKIDYLITISPETEKLNDVAGYMDLANFASENLINCFRTNSYSLKNEKDLE